MLGRFASKGEGNVILRVVLWYSYTYLRYKMAQAGVC